MRMPKDIEVNGTTLDKVLENHKHFIYKDCDDWEYMRADLQGADLQGACLQYVDLREADLREADLREADLQGAYLQGARLQYADLRGCELHDAKIDETTEFGYFPMACPEEGEFYGYKKAHNHIVKLLIPEDARRSSSTGRKCRCDKAKVVEIYNLDGSIARGRSIISDYSKDFIYKVGEWVSVPDFDTNRWNECAPGIHFFLNRQEAVEY